MYGLFPFGVYARRISAALFPATTLAPRRWRPSEFRAARFLARLRRRPMRHERRQSLYKKPELTLYYPDRQKPYVLAKAGPRRGEDRGKEQER